jgi:FlaA1/EpsC-like NDP-sugar epimerase
MRRYFMTIPEAAQLVLQAMSLGTGDEIFVLDMGTPVRISDLARSLIALHGMVPGRDVAVQYTGLRPGEKLFEELYLSDENLVRTVHNKIMVLKGEHVDRSWVDRQMAQYRESLAGSMEDLRRMLAGSVPEYLPTPASQGSSALAVGKTRPGSSGTERSASLHALQQAVRHPARVAGSQAADLDALETA